MTINALTITSLEDSFSIQQCEDRLNGFLISSHEKRAILHLMTIKETTINKEYKWANYHCEEGGKGKVNIKLLL